MLEHFSQPQNKAKQLESEVQAGEIPTPYLIMAKSTADGKIKRIFRPEKICLVNI